MNRKIIKLVSAIIVALPVASFAVPAAANGDLYQQHQWYLQNQSVGAINAAYGWSKGLKGAGVTIAVVDTGFTHHQDFGSNIIPGYDFVGYDNSNNLLAFTDGDNIPGRDADASDPGDYVDSNYVNRMAALASGYNAAQLSTCQSSDAKDSTWHGTMVSGILAAKDDNNIGIRGIVPQAKVVVSRALGKCGGYLHDIMDAARWSAGLDVEGVPANPNPAKIINLSLGGKGACSKNEQSAIDEIVGHGAIVVVAAGNQGGDVMDYSPANCKNTITVSSVSASGGRTKYSNYGKNVTISAPGGSGNAPIAVTSHSTANKVAPVGVESSKYKAARGTSFAAPLVSGVIAMMLEANPELTQPEIVLALRSTAKAFPQNIVNNNDDTLSACDNANCGAGIVDAKAAIQAVSGASDLAKVNSVAEEPIAKAPSSASSNSKSAGGAFSLPSVLALMLLLIRRKK